MSRPIRLQFAGAFYHVIGRGNAQHLIVEDDHDRRRFLDVVDEAVLRYGWLCHAYCIMDNHYHLLIETPAPNLSLGMRHVAGVYTQTFNRRHRRVGHLFQGRYKSVVVDREEYFAELARYIVLNPFRAGMARGPAYPWSSYEATAGIVPAPKLLTTRSILGDFGVEKTVAQREYKRFIAAGIADKNNESILTRIKNQCILGSELFIEKLAPHFAKEADLAGIPKKYRTAVRPKLEEILTEDLCKSDRNEAMSQAFAVHKYTQQEIANHTGLHYSWVSRLIAKTTKSKS